ASLFQAQSSAEARPADAALLAGSQRRPILTMRDSYSGYSAVAVDPVRNEVVMTDENLFSILTYDRTENTAPQAALSEPKRIIRGEKTDIEFQCSLWVDPTNGDIYAVNNDTLGKLVIFSREQRGNVEPDRFIETPHTSYGIAAHEPSNEIMLTIQDDAAVVTYPKTAQGKEPPIRLLQGEKTLLADPHGIAIDPRRDLLYVTNWGSVNTHTPPPGGAKTGTLGRGAGHPNWPIGRNYSVPGTGKFMAPSITVYPRTARGDIAPSRTIQGPKTQLNWPTALTVNPETRQRRCRSDPHPERPEDAAQESHGRVLRREESRALGRELRQSLGHGVPAERLRGYPAAPGDSERTNRRARADARQPARGHLRQQARRNSGGQLSGSPADCGFPQVGGKKCTAHASHRRTEYLDHADDSRYGVRSGPR
ncbi:MAG: hypothetical protein HW398_1102, partial [Acidobacteria bacterium]|nr:hypothetical protein [Acidobacteriota bacterium]